MFFLSMLLNVSLLSVSLVAADQVPIVYTSQNIIELLRANDVECIKSAFNNLDTSWLFVEKNGLYPLLVYAANFARGRFSLIKPIFDRASNVDVQNAQLGTTPLMVASYYDDYYLAHYLLYERRAFSSIVNKSRKGAIDIAIAQNSINVITLFQSPQDSDEQKELRKNTYYSYLTRDFVKGLRDSSGTI